MPKTAPAISQEYWRRNRLATNEFIFKSNRLRVVEIEGEPMFAAADACRCMSMDVTHGTSNWLRGIAPDEKRVVNRADYPDLKSGKGAPTITLITESGLYKLIMRSDKAEAREFQDWVTREVLPSIRKTGGYALAD